ncbi:VPDSG-CTERM sorting domain-containing protein [Pelagicoccus sp. SDUM812005]|uniref:VPDSG-CTERM sorting domain-containing protein n=1 Tax=Pelagicoccus sp. SDUM812005 TaxID=3041257 RepID=UPI00280E8588|nr:VPDSG-CTERM sorting domain-containing protein [Pelagicoccus sp. SDUM812005]MDQ8183179.1 VPDSG-CTERM sorting domain-containing protein [Pelagicoccus sp. SDUM812005]
MNNIKKTLLALALAFSSFQAQAVLIDNGDYTTDTETGLDWLDMSFTIGKTYNDVLSATTGGSLSGWRFATTSEFDALISSAVGSIYTPTASGNDSSILVQMQNLVSLLGYTYSWTTTSEYTVGFVDSSSLSFADARQFGYNNPNGFVRPASNTNWDASKDDDVFSSYRGSFLLRSSNASTVPDVGNSALLLGLALTGLAFFKRRK